MGDGQKPREIQRRAVRPLRSSLKQNTVSKPSQASTNYSQDVVTQYGDPGGSIGSMKQVYDVDGFTRLLLSGRKDPTSTATAAPPLVTFQGSSAGDTSSNTDASSISRQSLFDSIFEAHHDTPKSSHETSPSQETGVILSASPLARNGMSKPPVPQTRHGNLLDNVQASVPLNTSPSTVGNSPGSLPIDIQEPGLSSQTSTNLNKPLPAPPRPERLLLPSAENINPTIDPASEAITSDAPPSEPSSPMRSSAPPPLPPARRQSQRRPKSSPNYTHQPGTINEDHHTEQSSPIEKPTSHNPVPLDTSSMKPPPPPPRRNRPARSDSRSSMSSARSILSISERLNTSTEPVSSSLPIKSPPPLPPSRHAGNSSSKRPPHPSAVNSSGPAVSSPPPPPPRMRGSSQSSTSSSMLSGDYRASALGNGNRRGSGSSSTLPTSDDVPERKVSLGEKDVMADLTTLQREVDELRGKLGK